jgi:hypothetical protein
MDRGHVIATESPRSLARLIYAMRNADTYTGFVLETHSMFERWRLSTR